MARRGSHRFKRSSLLASTAVAMIAGGFLVGMTSIEGEVSADASTQLQTVAAVPGAEMDAVTAEPVAEEARRLVGEIGADRAGAEVALGVIYLTGQLGLADRAEAARWLDVAADAGNPFALYLRLRLREEDGLTSDPAAALKDSARLTELAQDIPELKSKVAAMMVRMLQVSQAATSGTAAVPAAPGASDLAPEAPNFAPPAPHVDTPVSSEQSPVPSLGDGLANDLVAGIQKGIEESAAPADGSKGEPTEQSGEVLDRATVDFGAPVTETPAIEAPVASDEAAQQAALEARKAAELEIEAKSAELLAKKAADLEAKKAAEAEAKKAAEMEAKKVAEREAEKAAELEAKKAAEIEAKKTAELEAKKVAEAKNAADLEAKRAAKKAEELARQKAAEAKKVAEAKKAAELEAQKAPEEARKAEAAQSIKADAKAAGVPVAAETDGAIEAPSDVPPADMSAFQRMVAEAQAQRDQENTAAIPAVVPEVPTEPSGMVNSAGQVLAEIPQAPSAAALQQLAMASSSSAEPSQTQSSSPAASGALLVARSSDPEMLLQRFREKAANNKDAMKGLEPDVRQVLAESGMTFVLAVYGFNDQAQMQAVCGIFGVKRCEAE